MTSSLHVIATGIFCACFLLVTIAGFWAARWRRASLHSLEEWGLAGRRFGTLITWFLIGGDFYTAYTVIAVPAAMYGTGAPGFFAIPYCILLYPYMMLVLPRLWQVCHRRGYVTLADFVRGRFGHRPLAMAVALTGILATMPYIALQLVGMQEVISALGLKGEWPLIAAFVILAAYTYSSGLRAPAVIAIVKDIMLYIMVAAAVLLIPAKLGGYAHVFSAAAAELARKRPPASILLQPSQYWSYATLAFGSALAIVLYPHTATGVLSSSSGRVIKRNAALLPAYNLLLALIALLGYFALAAGIHTADTSSAVPLLFVHLFPEWFAGFCLAAIGIGALVPAAIMSIAAANLFTRNLYGEMVRRSMTPRQEATQAKLVSLFLKIGALVFVLFVRAQYAIELQLLGGIWIAQIFPAVILGLFTRWFRGTALFLGWIAGMAAGTGMAWARDLKSSVYPLHMGGHTLAVYAAIPALLLNLMISLAFTLLLNAMGQKRDTDATETADYEMQQA
ncbi:monocarboxylate uptake permease MctP [Pseudacidobacterium ailaaui]|jgi:SSS family solute:Na+ symporter|uniref:monocarboxylate uptake permease MctP n=1 Tax=Pseudacidobacterium ailaaui TaxID=1382359 RepID=UPI0005D2364D|nr:sodium:solute symporter [Pseudacidobacterium ailaaui]